jgi:hypothetical protein
MFIEIKSFQQMYDLPDERKLRYLCIKRETLKQNYKVYPSHYIYFEILELNRQIEALRRFLTSTY